MVKMGSEIKGNLVANAAIIVQSVDEYIHIAISESVVENIENFLCNL